MKRSFVAKALCQEWDSNPRFQVETRTLVECQCNNDKVSNLESGALDRSAILTAFEEAGDCLFLALKCYLLSRELENWLRGDTLCISPEHFNFGCDKEERRTSLTSGIKTMLCAYLTRGRQAFHCTNTPIFGEHCTKRSKRVFYCCKERLDLMRSCFEFVKVGYAFRGNVNNLNSQMFVKEDLHQLLAPVKANTWASELERIAVFWCERSQKHGQEWDSNPRLHIEDQNTQILPLLLSLNQLMILSLAPLTTRPSWHGIVNTFFRR